MENQPVTNIQIHTGYRPGAIGRVVELHSRYYHAHWQFGAFFESKVAHGLAEFMSRYDKTRDCFWVVVVDDQVEGALVIDGAGAKEEGARLRWFILSDVVRGQGVGNRLMHAAVEFCREHNYPRIHLSTFEGLSAARHLYEKFGFVLVEQQRGAQWGVEVDEQRFELRLDA
jgi:GNAT superfamily N-acetyltransferase